MFSFRLLLATAFAFPLFPGTVVPAESPAPENTVFWISVDGLSPDYLDRADTPFLDTLRSKGAYSGKVAPVFPSVTFASHVSQATGVRPEIHGITGNSFYDSATQRTYRYPGEGALLAAEPIWITAARQGVRAAVLDWPLAHAQTGPHTSAYFGERFEGDLADEERLSRLLDLWENDDDEEPLRLIMGYTTSPDREGHRHGPNAPEVTEAVEKIDALLSRTFDRAYSIWRNGRPGPDAQFFFVITSDHGMSEVTTLIHPGNITGLEDREEIQIITTGNVGHIHLDQLPPREQNRVREQTLARLSEFDYVRAYPRDEIPENWGYRHPTRTGDILLVLKNGYTFSRRPQQIEMPVEEAGGPLGMHGYDPASNPEMLTPLFVFRAPELIGGATMNGPAHALQMHTTVSRLLGIAPAAEAVQDAIEW